MTERLIGAKLGAYTVRGLLGSGGMATVYRGYDPALDREVAIKVIATDGNDPDFVARFQREARVVASLRHPNIVHVYQFGEHEGLVYMVQELLPGPTLQEQIKRMGRRRMASDRVISIVSQLAAALDCAHASGVVHRDIKPSNALYNAQSQLVLTDFGLARGHGDVLRTATAPGMLMGSPAYIAPEQAISSASITPACDIYGLGVLAFELLTGRLPFDADTPMAMVLKHLYDDPPAPSSVRNDLPQAVDAVIIQALSKEPKARPSTATAFAEQLAAALGGVAPESPAPKKKARSSAPKTKPATSKANGAPAAARVSAAGEASTASTAKPKPKPKPKKTAAAAAPAEATTKPAPPTAVKPAAAAPATKPAPKPAARSTPATLTVPVPEPAPRRRRWPLWLIVFLALLIVATLVISTQVPALFNQLLETAKSTLGM